jgi:hypothetical protein
LLLLVLPKVFTLLLVVVAVAVKVFLLPQAEAVVVGF